jgi:hypothetical protein
MGKYIKKIIVDEDGEIVDEKVLSFYNPFKEGKGYNFKYKSIYIKSYLDIPLPEEFKDTEVGKIYRLSRHIYSDSNLLAKRSNNTIRPLTKEEVQEIVGLHRTKFNPFLKKLFKHKVLKIIPLNGEDYFCFNPLYFNSTTYLPIYLYIAFQKELKDHLPEWVINKYLDMVERKDEYSKEDNNS